MKQQRQTRAEGRASRTEPAKRYEPVREFERQTSYCPLYLAWRILARQIDALVYDLYLPCRSRAQAGVLTPAEIKIVEAKVK